LHILPAPVATRRRAYPLPTAYLLRDARWSSPPDGQHSPLLLTRRTPSTSPPIRKITLDPATTLHLPQPTHVLLGDLEAYMSPHGRPSALLHWAGDTTARSPLLGTLLLTGYRCSLPLAAPAAHHCCRPPLLPPPTAAPRHPALAIDVRGGRPPA
jgi:hypothetical protein